MRSSQPAHVTHPPTYLICVGRIDDSPHDSPHDSPCNTNMLDLPPSLHMHAPAIMHALGHSLITGMHALTCMHALSHSFACMRSATHLYACTYACTCTHFHASHSLVCMHSATHLYAATHDCACSQLLTCMQPLTIYHLYAATHNCTGTHYLVIHHLDPPLPAAPAPARKALPPSPHTCSGLPSTTSTH